MSEVPLYGLTHFVNPDSFPLHRICTAKVDEFAPLTQHVNLKNVSTSLPVAKQLTSRPGPAKGGWIVKR